MYVLDQRLDLHKMPHDIRVIVYLAVNQQVDIADAPGTVNICPAVGSIAREMTDVYINFPIQVAYRYVTGGDR